MTDIEQKLQAQIDELEMKQAFQEQTIEELNSALTQQQFLLDKLLVQVRYIAGKVQGSQVSNIASESEETPPPHY